jgi:hypothetical protein
MVSNLFTLVIHGVTLGTQIVSPQMRHSYIPDLKDEWLDRTIMKIVAASKVAEWRYNTVSSGVITVIPFEQKLCSLRRI